jgi:catechol 2,3-dioxygenase-like lactoylglutathione lyase family enzyme
MQTLGINHINIVVTAAQLPAVVAFYEQIIGLKQGGRAASKRDGAWLYCGDAAIIHLSVVEQSPYSGRDTHFNHVALACTGVADFVQCLDSANIAYETDYRSPPEMTQIFLHDPVGIRIELNFAGEKFSSLA